MGIIEGIQLDGKAPVNGLNICDTVGMGGINKYCDVLTVQAWFQYFYVIKYLGTTGLRSWDDLPERTGKCDDKLLNAILTYQRQKGNYVMSVDGIIHPANYSIKDKGFRNISSMKSDYMTITRLHMDTIDATQNKFDYTTQIIHEFPDLHGHLRKKE